MRRALSKRAAAALVALLALSGCRGEAPALEPARGLVLISLDTVGAVHLGAYGHRRDTTPFFDRLARRGVLFEQAFVQYPSTLVSHLSMLTGLYPQQHGVYPPSRVLSPSIEMVQERFARAGFRTAGHTEGGFVSAHYGFDRGFDEFADPIIRHDTDVEATFDRGLEFLAGLAPGERFFLFLHTYTAHDPYEPPEPFRGAFWPGPAPATFDSSKTNLAAVNRGERTVDEETLEFFHARYDEGLLYLDSQLRRLFDGIDDLGLTAATAVVVTADHGEEFLEHGRLGHSQVYPETLRVPLLVLAPGAVPRRVAAPVESIDLAPTLLELAGLEVPVELPGASLALWLRGPQTDDPQTDDPQTDAAQIGAPQTGGPQTGSPGLNGKDGEADAATAYAEVVDEVPQRTLIAGEADRLWQSVLTTPPAESDGAWITRSVAFDAAGERLELDAVAFLRPRRVEVTLDGRPAAPLELGTDWRPVALELGDAGAHRVTLATGGCDTPRALGLSDDPRCLSFKLRGPVLRRTELFDLAADPLAEVDLSRREPDRHRRLLARLLDLSWTPLDAPARPELPEETEEALRALGYVD